MRAIELPQSRSELVYQAIVDEICEGRLPAGDRLVQEQLAMRLGVSRQPVQQAMARLEADGLAEKTGRRGLCVATLDLDRMCQHYDLRAVLDGLAAASAARIAAKNPDRAVIFRAEGDACLALADRTATEGSIRARIHADETFHKTIYGFSGNPLIERSAEPHWLYLRRAMSDVLRHAGYSVTIGEEHAAILDAVCAGNEEEASGRAIGHVQRACELLVSAFGDKSA